jgi:exoribonuclease R
MSGVDGLLHTSALRDDDYVMETDGHGWRGMRKGRRLRTGTHVRVVVVNANPVEGLIDLELAPDE